MMDNKRIREFERLYSLKNYDDLVDLAVKLYSKNSTYEEDAKTAFINVLTQKELKVDDLLEFQKTNVLNDKSILKLNAVKKHEKHRKQDRFWNKVFAYLGIPIAIFIGIQSFEQKHLGGFATSVILLLIAFYNLNNEDSE